MQILLYVLLAWGLNITVGLAGLLDLGYVAFYALAPMPMPCSPPMTGLSFWALLPICGALAAFWGFCIGFPVLRLRGDYLAIVTLAFAEIVRTVLINWDRRHPWRGRSLQFPQAQLLRPALHHLARAASTPISACISSAASTS